MLGPCFGRVARYCDDSLPDECAPEFLAEVTLSLNPSHTHHYPSLFIS